MVRIRIDDEVSRFIQHITMQVNHFFFIELIHLLQVTTALVVFLRPIIILLLEAVRHGFNQIQRLLAFMSHQTNSARINDLEKFLQIDKTHARRILEMTVQIRVQLVLLVVQITEIDEKPRAHVFLHRVHLGFNADGLVALDQQITVFQQAATTDLLR